MQQFQNSAPAECSTARPWGIHPAFFGYRCPRCGFLARGATKVRSTREAQRAV